MEDEDFFKMLLELKKKREKMNNSLLKKYQKYIQFRKQYTTKYIFVYDNVSTNLSTTN